mgnify:CR=1 FL=1
MSDAFTHCKYIGYSAAAEPLFVKAGILDDLDEGCFLLAGDDIAPFIDALSNLRLWGREAAVDLDAQPDPA